jgi:uncharacterized protein (TIGR02231 family)
MQASTTTPRLPAEVDVTAPVVEVVVLEDRAKVTRRCEVELEGGRIRLRVDGVAPVLSDRSLAVALGRAPEGARVIDTRVRRVPVPESEADDEVDRQLLAAEARHGRLTRQLGSLGEHRKLIETMTVQALDDIAVDTAWCEVDPRRWASSIQETGDRERDLRDQALTLATEMESLEQSIRDLRRRSEAADRPDRTMTAWLEVEVESEAAGTAQLEVSYLVPAACWRPQHSARLDLLPGGDGLLNFQTSACVWQRTGEDWRDVLLRCSTQRPSLGAEPPLLDEDEIAVRERPEQIVVEARDQVIHTTGLGEVAGTGDQLPGIDDGGSALTLAASHTADVLSDGRPSRVELFDFEAPAEVDRVAMPELSEAVITRVECANSGASPILAGPVDLIAGCGLVGRTTTLMIAPGERFTLGFGPDPSVRVRRKVERVEHETGALSRSRRSEHNITILLSNIGRSATSFELVERVPVSEVEQVRISVDAKASASGVIMDENGFARWRLTLPASATRTITLRYTVESSKRVAGL